MQDGWLAVVMIACAVFGALFGAIVAVSMVRSECMNFGATTLGEQAFVCQRRV